MVSVSYRLSILHNPVTVFRQNRLLKEESNCLPTGVGGSGTGQRGGGQQGGTGEERGGTTGGNRLGGGSRGGAG